MNINEKLLSIYHNKWQALSENLQNLKLSQYANPLILSFDNKRYESADIRVMIFGQETKGWLNGDGSLKTIDEASSRYYSFFCLEKFYKGYGRSSFWKAFRLFDKEIRKANPDKKIYFSWNNINKIGRLEGTGTDPEVEKIEKEFFSVVRSEVELFEPDIVIFLTGPSRDSKIRHHFEDAEFISVDSTLEKRAIAKVKSQYLPEKTIRLYHPSYFGGFNKVRKKAISLITG